MTKMMLKWRGTAGAMMVGLAFVVAGTFGDFAWGQEWPLTDTRETGLSADHVSVPVHVASMCDPGHQRYVA